ncbi:hypothetical protein HUU05_14920 [candidate division KSB1 bacterium]|nr:hypothetical protein [candidate division KSB1 bacterium]
MVPTHARAKLGLADLQFIVSSLCRAGERETTLFKLLGDAEIREAMLEHPRLLECVLEARQPAAISPFLYFYLLVRQALKDFAIDDRDVAEYVANLLAEFGKSGRAQRVDEHATKEYRYLVDMMSDLLTANSEQTFHLRSHLGDYALFLTGLFPAHVYHRAKYHPPAPDFSYYESVGSNSFRLAAQHAQAERLRLNEVLELLGRHFKRVRLALNHAVENYMHLDRNANSWERVRRRVDQFIAEQRGETFEQSDWID